jgi:Putative Na+/H+ antiporter
MVSESIHTPLVQYAGALLFGLALLHTFGARFFEVLAHRHPRHAGLLHLLGEVEVVFGLWASVLLCAMALLAGGSQAVAYAESLQYTEPLFVFVVMVIAASRPVLVAVQASLQLLARALPMSPALAMAWLGLALVPLLGSLITEPAAMTLAALVLGPLVFNPDMPERLKYAALGVLFVNVSIGGTLTSYAAPPVLMVASAWHWDTAFMASTFGWKAALAVLVNASGMVFALRRHLSKSSGVSAPANETPVPALVSAIHLLFLAGVVLLAHHPVLFLGLFLFFLGYVTAYAQYQSPLILREGLLVGFFLAGLVVLGGMQRWWLQPLVSGLEPAQLFAGALALTAVTDNAALTYLGSLIEGLSPHARYMLVAGAVAGGGLTVVANAPNPAGVALLRQGFAQGSVGAAGLLLGALAPTVVATFFFLAL